MVFNVSIAMTWVLFLALFPMAFFWLRRAWRIAIRRDFSEVALKRGVPPANPERWAPAEAVINLIAGGLCIAVILMVLLAQIDFKTWTSIAGLTIWGKIIASFILSRHAHLLGKTPKR